MALVKCPECGNMVSTNADFCPKCGCKIGYIIDFYKKQEKPKQETKKDFPDEVKIFFERIKNLMSAHNIPYKETGIVGEYKGIKCQSESFSFCYVNYGYNGIRVHFYNRHEKRGWSLNFKESDEDEYLEIISDQILRVESKKPEDRPVTFNQLKNYYKLGIYNNKIVGITIIYTEETKDDTMVIYRVTGTSYKQKCLLSEIDKHLFRFRPAAEARLKELDEVDVKEVYGIMDKQSNLFVKGTHTSTSYESMGLYNRNTHPQLYEVADYTMNKDEAAFFFDEKAADNYRTKFEDSDNLVVIKFNKELGR